MHVQLCHITNYHFLTSLNSSWNFYLFIFVLKCPHLVLWKLSSSLVSGKNTSPPPSHSFRLDFFLFILKGSLKPLFFGEGASTAPGSGLRAAGLPGRVAAQPGGKLGASSVWVAAVASFPPGDFNLKRPLTRRVADLLMVTVGQTVRDSQTASGRARSRPTFSGGGRNW